MVQNRYNRWKQRYLYKGCGRNCTGIKNGYPEIMKREGLRYYIEDLDKYAYKSRFNNTFGKESNRRIKENRARKKFGK